MALAVAQTLWLFQRDDKSPFFSLLQREWTATNSRSPRPGVLAYGVGACVFLFLYNASLKQLTAIHFDQRTISPKAADDKLKESNFFLCGKLHAYFVGGYKEHPEVISAVMKIVQLLKGLGFETHLEHTFKLPFLGGYSYVSFDSRTGKLDVDSMKKMPLAYWGTSFEVVAKRFEAVPKYDNPLVYIPNDVAPLQLVINHEQS